MAPKPRPQRPASAARGLSPALATAIGAALLALHLVLLVVVATHNSVTYDENFHLPAGIVALTRGDFVASYAQPPLARVVPALAALAAGAQPPDPAAAGAGEERALGDAFQVANADRYERVFLAARGVTMLLSLMLAWIVWRTARRWSGEAGGLLALATWALAPEALAHGSVVGVDLPTALVFTGMALAGAAFLRSGRWRAWAVLAAWTAAAFLVRFSALQALVALVLLAILLTATRRLHRPGRAWLGLALLPLVAVLAIDVGYAFQGVGTPLRAMAPQSEAFRRLVAVAGALPSPLPMPWWRGIDYVALLASAGQKASYLLGEIQWHHDWRYFPVALACKWPIGLLALVPLRLVRGLRGERHVVRAWTLLVPAAVVLLWTMASDLDYGVRYLLPVLPLACIAIGGLAAPWPRERPAAGGWAVVAVMLFALESVESARALPYPLAFFNTFAGGPGNGDRIVNDSNVDWGQGLIALKADMRRLGISRVHLAYNGSTDPRLYGIDYVPYLGGRPGTESDWLAISSYFLVGLPGFLGQGHGQVADVQYRMGALEYRTPDARPGGSLYLFRIR